MHPCEETAVPLGTEINSLVAKRNRIRKLEEKTSALKKDLKEAESALRKRLVAQGMDSARGRAATVTVTSREVCRIEDYNRFAAYVYKYKALDLLQSRPSITALRERQKQGKKVPGVSVETLPTLSIRSRS